MADEPFPRLMTPELQAAFDEGHTAGLDLAVLAIDNPYHRERSSGRRQAWLNGFSVGRIEVRGS